MYFCTFFYSIYAQNNCIRKRENKQKEKKKQLHDTGTPVSLFCCCCCSHYYRHLRCHTLLLLLSLLLLLLISKIIDVKSILFLLTDGLKKKKKKDFKNRIKSNPIQSNCWQIAFILSLLAHRDEKVQVRCLFYTQLYVFQHFFVVLFFFCLQFNFTCALLSVFGIYQIEMTISLQPQSFSFTISLSSAIFLVLNSILRKNIRFGCSSCCCCCC